MLEPSVVPAENAARGILDPEVQFLGWQETQKGDIFPLYNVVKRSHPSFQTTVSEKSLEALHLRIPRTPSPFNGTVPAPWHDLGTEIDNLVTAREVIEAAGLDYIVAKVAMREIPGVSREGGAHTGWATVRTDTGAVLGNVAENYMPIQNQDAFTFFDTLVKRNDATYETAGVLEGGTCAWILARLPGFIQVHGRDIVARYLLLSNTHDGTSLVRVKVTPIRVVCNNTLTAALQGAGDVYIHHTSNVTADVQQANTLRGVSAALFDQLDIAFHRMAHTKITDDQLQEYVKALIPDNEQGADNAANRGIRKAVLDLYESGQGADLSRGTLWGAFNCVSEYTDHAMEGTPSSRLQSNWFGRGEQLKMKAYQLAERLM